MDNKLAGQKIFGLIYFIYGLITIISLIQFGEIFVIIFLFPFSIISIFYVLYGIHIFFSKNQLDVSTQNPEIKIKASRLGKFLLLSNFIVAGLIGIIVYIFSIMSSGWGPIVALVYGIIIYESYAFLSFLIYLFSINSNGQVNIYHKSKILFIIIVLLSIPLFLRVLDDFNTQNKSELADSVVNELEGDLNSITIGSDKSLLDQIIIHYSAKSSLRGNEPVDMFIFEVAKIKDDDIDTVFLDAKERFNTESSYYRLMKAKHLGAVKLLFQRLQSCANSLEMVGINYSSPSMYNISRFYFFADDKLISLTQFAPEFPGQREENYIMNYNEDYINFDENKDNLFICTEEYKIDYFSSIFVSHGKFSIPPLFGCYTSDFRSCLAGFYNSPGESLVTLKNEFDDNFQKSFEINTN